MILLNSHFFSLFINPAKYWNIILMRSFFLRLHETGREEWKALRSRRIVNRPTILGPNPKM